VGTRAGIASGLAAFGTFLVVHSLWITPIWHIAPVGALFAAAIGAAVGKVYEGLPPRLTGLPWGVGAAFAGGAASLAPAIVLAESGLRAGVAALPVVVASHFGSAMLVGATVGVLIRKTRRFAGTGALAGLLLAAGPGHNIPVVASTAAARLEMSILLVVLAVASVVLPVSYSLLGGAGSASRS